jgi:AraC family transcriptional regulator of adaptative response/methylated-DNA-[protein]-cysteine methyltransferase
MVAMINPPVADNSDLVVTAGATLDQSQAVLDYMRIAAAIRYIEAHRDNQPSLDAVAAHLHLSPWHFQRLFARWAGISPKRFVQYLTVDHARALLARTTNVLDASLESGLSGPGRLHDLFVHVEAVTPGEYKSGGQGLTIRYGVHASPFGLCQLAITERGICGLSFLEEDGGETARALALLRAQWPAATLLRDQPATARVMVQVFAVDPLANPQPVHLLLKGTNFQLKVWEALLRIPPGSVTTYENVAQDIQQPTAARAVGSAVGANAIAYLIPCHRVIRKSGLVEGYRWGTVRKKAILGWEAAHTERS